VQGSQLGLAPLDIVVLTAYLGRIAAIGLYVSSRARNTAGFFMGDRKSGKALMVII
jgi:Na+/proline symporter